MNKNHQTETPSRTDGMNLVRAACRALSEKKGENIVALDVRSLSSTTDFHILVSGTSAPHIKAMRNDLLLVLKKRGIACYSKAGDPESGWLILDYGDVIVHLFIPSIRAYYALEDLWPQKAIDLDDILGPKATFGRNQSKGLGVRR